MLTFLLNIPTRIKLYGVIILVGIVLFIRWRAHIREEARKEYHEEQKEEVHEAVERKRERAEEASALGGDDLLNQLRNERDRLKRLLRARSAAGA